MSEHEFECEIDEAEWQAVSQRILPFCAEDERFGSGQLLLRSSDSVRTWWSTDGRVVARLDVGASDTDYLWTISPRILASWWLAAGGTGLAKICVSESTQGNQISIRGAGGSFSLPQRNLRYPALGVITEQYDQAASATAVVEAEGFYYFSNLIKNAPQGPFLDEDRDVPPCELTVTADSLTSNVLWPGLGENLHSLQATTTGTASMFCSPVRLHETLGAFETGELSVSIPQDSYEGDEPPIRLQQGSLTIYVLARGCELALDSLQVNYVAPVLEECFGPDVLNVDEGGDYELSVLGAPVFARELAGDPNRLCIFATVVKDIEQSPELLAELNDLNTGYGFVKLLWKDGDVLVAGDLVAETVDAAEVLALYERVRFVASEISPTLAAVHGGVAAKPIEVARWQQYTRTAVLAEMTQGKFVDLSGPDAVVDWPFEGAVHALTAWNPFGRRRGDQWNQLQTSELAGRLIYEGGSVLRSDGRSYEGDYVEGGLLVWGLDTEQVRSIAMEFEQEAVFRLDADTLEVLGVFTDRIASRPRLERRNELQALNESLQDPEV
ncbi:MAG: DUF3293 domain-containing protein [Microthrixaceae bacterium]